MPIAEVKSQGHTNTETTAARNLNSITIPSLKTGTFLHCNAFVVTDNNTS